MPKPPAIADPDDELDFDDEPDAQPEDAEDLFASPESGTTTQKPAPPASSSTTKRPGSRHGATGGGGSNEHDARDARLRAELERIREVNRVIEGVAESLAKAKLNLATVHRTVAGASTLLATWTRILGQTEHNQRLILNPAWHGASQDIEDMENEELRRAQEAERRVQEEQRRREEVQRRAEEEERRKAAAAAGAGSRRGVSRTRSTRGTASTSTRGYVGVGGQSTRGRGAAATASTRAGSGIGRGIPSSTRARGRGLG